MKQCIPLIALVAFINFDAAESQAPITLKTAVVALAEDANIRADFEEGLVTKARDRNYNVVTSHSFVPNVTEIDDEDFISRMRLEGVGAVLMMRPAAVGAGSTLESVKDEVTPRVFADMQAFARELSPSGEEDLIAVIHMAIYLISESGAQPLSAGAVWLDEEVDSQDVAIERLQDLIVANVDAVRPAIREHLGLPPLN